jgi:hypothetical protein
MIGAARLQVRTFEDVETDRSATRQAVLVVVVVAIATGVGSLGGGLNILLAGVAFSLIVWALWAWLTYFVGTRLLPTPQTHADWGQLARALAFAQSPGVLKVLGGIPGIGPPIFILAVLWQLVAAVVAVRQALDYDSTWRAVGVVLIAGIPYLVLSGILAGLMFGGQEAG